MSTPWSNWGGWGGAAHPSNAVPGSGHKIPLAGHVGTEKTRQRILRRFYWPTLFRDVEQFCKSCIKCQKSGNLKVPKAPPIPLPVISESFTRMAMEIVWPLPRSSAGHKYILVMCDNATRYPEAVPLRSIDAEHCSQRADQSICQSANLDQGSNFISLQPRLSVPDFVSQLWRKIGGRAWKDFTHDTVAPSSQQ